MFLADLVLVLGPALYVFVPFWGQRLEFAELVGYVGFYGSILL